MLPGGSGVSIRNMGSEEVNHFRPSIVVKAEPLDSGPFEYTSLSETESRVVFRNYYEVHTDGNIMERTSSVESLHSESESEQEVSARTDKSERSNEPSPCNEVKSEYFSFPAYRADWKPNTTGADEEDSEDGEIECDPMEEDSSASEEVRKSPQNNDSLQIYSTGSALREHNSSGNVSLDRQDVVIPGIPSNTHNGINIVFHKHCNLNMDTPGKLYGRETYSPSEGYLTRVERYAQDSLVFSTRTEPQSFNGVRSHLDAQESRL